MSTATTLKRVALAAVYALGFGLMSVAPSSAVVNNSSLALSSATATYTLGSPAATTTATVGFVASEVGDDVTVRVTVSGVAGSAALPSVSGANTATYTVNVSGGSQLATVDALLTATAIAAPITISLTPDKAGVYTVLVEQLVGTTLARSSNWVVTAAAPVVTASTVRMTTVTGSPALFGSDTGTMRAPVGVSLTEVARIDVRQYSLLTAFETSSALISSTYSQAVSVSITGAGLISKLDDGSGLGTVAEFAATSGATSTVYIYPDARSGAAAISVSVGGTVVGTKTFTFVGAAASIKVDTTTVLPNIAVGASDAIQFNASDANGNLSGNTGLVFAASSDATIATVDTPVAGLVTVTGVKPGTAKIQVCTAACSSTATTTIKSEEVTVTVLPVASGNAFKVTLSLDKATYAAGEKMTLTISASDTSTPALAIADGARTLLSAAGLTSNATIMGLGDATATATLVGGKASYTLYAPVAGGNFTISGTDATTAKNAVSVSFAVSNPAQEAADAAADAALEAIDAANAATDAANLAAEAADAATVAAEEARDAADAATAAVEALAAEVSTMISEIKAQLTALANVVAKIAKKVKA